MSDGPSSTGYFTFVFGISIVPNTLYPLYVFTLFDEFELLVFTVANSPDIFPSEFSVVVVLFCDSVVVFLVSST